MTCAVRLANRFLLVAVVGAALAQDTAQAKPAAGAVENMVAMRDGVKLATNVYLPQGEGPFPVVLMRTPYGKDGTFALGADRYRKAGYVYVVQDCRGRFRSEGNYTIFEADRDDGHDTITWITQQPWCNGRVGMTGGSAMGITGLLAAISQHENLRCAYVAVAPESFWTEATFIGGVFKEADVSNWLKGQDKADEIPFRRASLSNTNLEMAQDIVQHRDKIRIPIMHVGGWYDIFSVGTQGNFVYLQNRGAEGARGKQKLVMGPYGHGGLKGDLKYPEGGGLLTAISDDVAWFDYHLKGLENGVASSPPVRYYQMAAAKKGSVSDKNGWQTADNWPLPSTPSSYYLTADRGLSAAAPTHSDSTTSYAYDPEHPVPTVGGANLSLPIGPLDQREVGQRDDYLRFQSPPLEADVRIAGRVYVDLFASTDGPDTDFMVKLIDVYPDGYEALILDQPLRARFRNGHRPEQAQMMTPGQPTRMTIELGSTANQFEAGHRIAVHVTSSNYPRFEVNPNTGVAPPGGVTEGQPTRVAKNTIHHDAAHPTALVLPVVE